MLPSELLTLKFSISYCIPQNAFCIRHIFSLFSSEIFSVSHIKHILLPLTLIISLRERKEQSALILYFRERKEQGGVLLSSSLSSEKEQQRCLFPSPNSISLPFSFLLIYAEKSLAFFCFSLYSQERFSLLQAFPLLAG